jgi:hypothetical protein
MFDDMTESAKYAARDGLRGQNGGFFNSFLRRFKERLVFNLIITLATLGIVIIVFLYIAFVIIRAL